MSVTATNIKNIYCFLNHSFIDKPKNSRDRTKSIKKGKDAKRTVKRLLKALIASEIKIRAGIIKTTAQEAMCVRVFILLVSKGANSF